MELPNLGYYIGNIKIHRNLSELGETVGAKQVIVVRGRSMPKLNVEKGPEEVGNGCSLLVGNPAICRVMETALVMFGRTSVMHRY
jgi:hypothetical protein